jgi:hypothetical protein
VVLADKEGGKVDLVDKAGVAVKGAAQSPAPDQAVIASAPIVGIESHMKLGYVV